MLNTILSKPILRLSVVILFNENILKVLPLLSKDISRRHFARWSTRTPSKVFTQEDVSSGSFRSKEFYQSEYGSSKSSEKEPVKYGERRVKDEVLSQKKKSSSDVLDYQVLGEQDFTYSKLMTSVGNRKMRRKHNLIMLEGKRLNMDALQSGLKPKKLFFTQKSFLEELQIPPDSGVHLYKMPYKTMELWSRLEAPPGVVGFYGIPKEKDITPVDTLPVKVVCDNVRDPGNLGSIIRVAAGVGCTQIILMKGCTDPWDSKVLRSASGGHFHIPINMDLMWSDHKDFLEPSDHIFIADSQPARSQDDLPVQLYHDVNFSETRSVVVVIGGETEGISSEALRLASQHRGSRLYIPLSNCMESLNSGSALSVILFEIKRQFLVNDNVKKNKEENVPSDSVKKLISSRSIS